MDDFQEKLDELVRDRVVPYLEEHFGEDADTLMVGVVAGIQDEDEYKQVFAALPFTDEPVEEHRRRARGLFEHAARQYA